MITTEWARNLAWRPGFEQCGRELEVVARNIEHAYIGGTPFFDHLDETLRSDHWFQPLRMFYELAEHKVGTKYPDLALSGQFGRRFAAYMRDHYTSNTYVFPGNLRHVDLPPLPIDLTGHKFAFIDDSYYRGRTFGKIKSRIEEAGGEMLWAMVLYDGAPTPPSIPSFYRYHPIEGMAS